MMTRTWLNQAWILTFLFGYLLANPVFAQQSPKEVLEAIVGIESTTPIDARTALTLGTERDGSGVVIDDQGLVLTIGYLILEASSVTITTHDGTQVKANIIAYDYSTGFGLVRATEPLNVSHLEFGDSSKLGVGDAVLIISTGGTSGIRPARVVSRRVFPGYWEYLLENAIFTAPPHTFFSGSALIGADNKLLGIGSLIVRDAVVDDPTPGNMFVPIDLLKPIVQSLVETGRDPKPRRPWLGIYTEEYRGHVFVSRVAVDGPAMKMGVQPDDIVVKVAGKPVSTMEAFFRAMWSVGDAGVSIPLTILRNSEVIEMEIQSSDRYQWLKLAPQRLTTMN